MGESSSPSSWSFTSILDDLIFISARKPTINAARVEGTGFSILELGISCGRVWRFLVTDEEQSTIHTA